MSCQISESVWTVRCFEELNAAHQSDATRGSFTVPLEAKTGAADPFLSMNVVCCVCVFLGFFLCANSSAAASSSCDDSNNRGGAIKKQQSEWLGSPAVCVLCLAANWRAASLITKCGGAQWSWQIYGFLFFFFITHFPEDSRSCATLQSVLKAFDWELHWAGGQGGVDGRSVVTTQLQNFVSADQT